MRQTVRLMMLGLMQQVANIAIQPSACQTTFGIEVLNAVVGMS